MIFFVAYGGGHVASLAPVAARLQQAGYKCLFLALTTARDVVERMGIPAIGFRDLPGARDADVIAYGMKLAADLPAGGSVEVAETVAYLGLSYRDLVAQHGAEKAAQLYAQHGRSVFLPVPTLLAAFAAYKPQLLVTTNSPRAEQAAQLAASACGVRSVCVVDLFALHEIKWVGMPGFADRVCVLNEEVKQRFVVYGRPAEDLHVTGNPAFDGLHASGIVAAGAMMRSAKGWLESDTVILWASQIESASHPFTGQKGDPTLPRRIECHLRGFVASNAGYRLVIRYHPSEREVFVPAPMVEFSPPGEDLSTLLHAVDLVVVTASTVGLQAKLAGRQVLSVDDSIYQADAPYSSMGISIGVARVEDLSQALRDLPARQPRKSVAGGLSAESATAKVVDVVMALF